MSMMIIATSLSAVGAAAFTVGGLALRERWAARAKAQLKTDIGPVQGFAAEHAVLSSLSPAAPGLSEAHMSGVNTGRFADPKAAVAEVSAMQIRLTGETALESRPLNAVKSERGEVRHDA